MRRFLAIILVVAAALGAQALAPKSAEAGRISFGIGIGFGAPVYGYPVYRPRYYRPYGYRRYYRPRYYGRRYYRPRRVYPAQRVYRPVRRRTVRRQFSAAHYGYCSTRYRSYRVSDNTFQPYRGRRKQCRSRF